MVGGSTTGSTMAMIPVIEDAKIAFISLAGAIQIIQPVRPCTFAIYQHTHATIFPNRKAPTDSCARPANSKKL
jgi:hypothetical protein